MTPTPAAPKPSLTNRLFMTAFGLMLGVSLFAQPPTETVKAVAPKADIAQDFTYPLADWGPVHGGGEFGAFRGTGIYHLGTDGEATAGTPVYSIGNGIVKHIGIHSRFGTVVLIEHTLADQSKIVSLYGHMRTTTDMPAEGSEVIKGQYIGQIGTQGEENGYWAEHLHFGLRKGAYIPVEEQWVYWGLGSQTKLAEWYDAELFFPGKLAADVDPKRLARYAISPSGKMLAQVQSYVRNQKNGRSLELETGTFFGFPTNWLSGADIATGDLDGDGNKEIILGAGPGGAPEVRVFNRQQKKLIGSFMAYAPSFKGGVRVSAGDLDGDGKDEIITGAGPGGGAHVRVFSDANGTIRFAKLFPFDASLRTGVDVATGDLNGDGKDEILVGTGPGSAARVRVIENNGTLRKKFELKPYPDGFKGGVRVSAGDLDGDGKDEIITGAGPGGGPHVRAFSGKGKALAISFFPFATTFRGGVDVATTDFDGDKKDEIVMVQNSGGQAWVKVYAFDKEKTIYSEFNAYGNVEPGANVAGF